MAAMNTGHEGGCSTVHANSVADLPARFEALGVAAGLSRQAVHAQLASAISVVLHLQRDLRGRRRVTEIGVVARDHGETVAVLPAVSFVDGRGPQPGEGARRWDRLLERGRR